MNKKKLSVVMAGAMLASSVAPVLAATHETTHGNIGLFINDLEAFMNTKKYDVTDKESGKSVYRFQILDAKGIEVSTLSNGEQYKIVEGKPEITLYSDAYVLKELNSSEEYTVKVYELGNVTTDKGIFSVDKIAESDVKYDAKSFAQLVSAVKNFEAKKATGLYGLDAAISSGWVTGLALNKEETEVTVELGSFEEGGLAHKTIKLSIGSNKVLFKNPIDASGRVLANVVKTDVATEPVKVDLADGVTNDYIQKNIVGFSKDVKPASTKPVSIAAKNAKLLEEVKILNGDKKFDVNVNDLYDGFMLTDKGHELMNAIREFEANPKAGQWVWTVKDGKGTERYFNVELVDANGTKTVVKIFGNSLQKAKLETLRNWYAKRVADVEELSGSNRYATAVEIAKTYLSKKGYQYDGSDERELVLINGTALVDGLAAAPYAKAKNAPILLTETSSLPRETKAYMKELVSSFQIGQLDNKQMTVTIVGGEAVVSNSVVKELKEIGFKVKRIAGDNREETSLAVADKLTDYNYNKDKAFVVGAEGEADAMSIAAHAAKIGAPIVVAKSAKGLSTVGLNEVSEYANVEIVGGKSVVPVETEDALKELVDNEENVTRIDGKDRYETNALVIKAYHKGFQDALIAKDGKANKSELIDALPASLFASDVTGPAAPIVLATKNISREQLNQLVSNAAKGYGRTVYQIGGGVSRSVMETVVTKLGLNR